MRRCLSLLAILFVTGCSTLYSALPNRAAVGPTSGMTVEQYAIGRLATPPSRRACQKGNSSASRTGTAAKRCSR